MAQSTDPIQVLQSGRAYVTVKPLVSGTLTLPEYAFVAPADRSVRRSVPSMCFLVEHPKARFMFDLGLRAEAKNYVPNIQAHLLNRQPVTHRPSAPEILAANGIDPATIQAVILSHVHWDHHGDPVSFPKAAFYVGHGSLEVITHGLPGLGAHSHFDPNLFDYNAAFEFSNPEYGKPALDSTASALTPLIGKSAECQSPLWQALGSFPGAADLYADGSVFLLPTPGHLPGHMNLLCRVSPTKWIYLGGDVYHDVRLLTGEKKIAVWEEKGREFCIHVDREEAARSIARISELSNLLEEAGLEMEVITAHDAGWWQKNKGRCLTA